MCQLIILQITITQRMYGGYKADIQVPVDNVIVMLYPCLLPVVCDVQKPVPVVMLPTVLHTVFLGSPTKKTKYICTVKYVMLLVSMETNG